jgi:CheY-like chemotaxis protein
MKSSHRYVLVLDSDSDTLQRLESILRWIHCPMATASSLEQAIAKINDVLPSLIILSGSQTKWSKSLLHKLRPGQQDTMPDVMIVALTDSHATSWVKQEENPGFDGFLVKPLSPDVVSSLVQSAWARQGSDCVGTF